MDKLKMHSPDLVAGNIERLAELFPGCVTESRCENGELKRAVDFDLLRQELSDHVVDGSQERYRLDWPGKREALLAANAPIAKTLRPCREESVDFDTTQNLFIEGDNLDALKLLQETYLGRVKTLYIDPPYNTGNDFVYNDNFSTSKERYHASTGQVSSEGELVANPESGGRFHSSWLSMMYPRLRLAHTLLADDGVLFISIDDNEVANLCKICDEIFGDSSFVGSMCWVKKRKGSFLSKTIVSVTEWLLVYGKTSNVKLFGGIADPSESQPLVKRTNSIGTLKFPASKVRTKLADGAYAPGFYGEGSSQVELIDEISVSNGLIQNEFSLRGPFIWSQDYLNSQLSGGATLVINTNNLQVRAFKAPNDDSYKGILSLINGVDLSATNEDGYEELRDLLEAEKIMDYPKPTRYIEHLVNAHTHWDRDALIVDFFAGSASTAQAVMATNAVDGGSRRYIMVQLPEETQKGSAAATAGYKTIAEIGKERIRRAGRKIKSDHSDKNGINNLDTGFRVLKIDSSNMAEVYYRPDELKQDDLLSQIDNIRPGRTAEDLLFQVLLDWGVDLALPIAREDVDGREVFFVDSNALAACFVADGSVDEALVKQIAQRQPLRVVFRDAGFASDNARVNVEQIFKALSPSTEVRTL